MDRTLQFLDLSLQVGDRILLLLDRLFPLVAGSRDILRWRNRRLLGVLGLAVVRCWQRRGMVGDVLVRNNLLRLLRCAFCLLFLPLLARQIAEGRRLRRLAASEPGEYEERACQDN